MKRFLATFLVLVLIVLSFPMGIANVLAQTTSKEIVIWGGLQKAQGGGSFTKGDGTAENPYIIENGDQLYLMVYNFGTTDLKLNGTAAHYKLGCDIYLNDISNYDSWGKAGFDMSSLNNWAKFEDSFCHRTFYGNFNGDGHTIYGLYASSYRVASFFPNVGHGAVVRNVNFKNSYVVNTSNVNANDQEEAGTTAGEKVWYAGVYGSAGVLFSRADAAGDSDYNTVDFTINNCSVIDAYVEAKYFTSSFVAAANSCQPYIANCMTANITLDSTSTTQGVEGAILNMAYGSTNATSNMENILAVGYPIYGAGRNEMWSGLKKPSVSHTYTFKNVYSTVSNKYTFNHSSYGNLSFTDSEVTVVDAAKLIGAQAESTITTFDWAYTWRTVEGGYPVPMREYVVPSGDEYYQNGGPKYATDVWDGTAASHFAAGDGSVEDPYLIANCEEFYRMATMPEDGKYYKIADGVTDLYFNDIESKSYSTLMTYFSWGIGTKYGYSDNICFNGSFDGNGVTFHGVLSSSSNYAGLFTKLGNATLKNFNIRYSYFKTSSSSATGAAAIAAQIEENSVVQIKNVAVIDSNVDGRTAAAGFVGNVKSGAKVYIENSIVSAGKIASKGQPAYQAAFVADGLNAAVTVKNSISLGIYPASNSAFSYNSVYSNVYTDTVPTAAADGVNKVENSALQGEAAKTTCSEFNWNYSWSVTETVPMPKNQQNDNGVVGTAWSGEIASSFAGGNGTKANPYLINTAEMLARMLVYGNSGEYYKLTADIYINDTTQTNWKNGAKEWFTSKDVSAFEGCIDGNGFVVYGLYANAGEQGEYVALIPVLGTESQVRKIKLNDSYLVGSEGTYLGGIAGVLEDNAAVASIIDACVIDNNVTFAGEANVGGIIANVGFARAIVENCLFRGNITTSGNSYGICENVIGKLDVYESISKNEVPFMLSDKINAMNIYTDMQTDKSGVIVLETSNMTGIVARNYMKTLDFSLTWKLNSSNTPEPTGNTKTYKGVKGEVWSGKVASSFAGGNGTQTNPYIIETGEQLALLITKANNYNDKFFKLGCDIYLNDVNGELWQSKSGALNWINSHDAGYLRSHLDGDGYVVYGMYYNLKSTPSNSYLGLIPRLAGSSQIKNVGISQAYIKVSTNDNTVYAGGLFGMGSAIYDFYGNKIGVASTEGDEFLIPGQTTPTKLPSFTNCFVDHTCYIEAYSAGGIGCPGGAAIVIRDSYVTATIKGAKDSSYGGLMGPNWADCSRIYNSISFTQNDIKSLVGNHQWINSESSICTYIENVYYYGNKYIFGTQRIKRPQWRVDEAAKTNMPILDWESIWRVEEDGTPVLRVFEKDGRSAGQFSDKYFNAPDVKISFDTNADDVVVEDVSGKAYESVTLPTPQREGYKFVAWHSFEDLTCEYEYDFFLSRDITLYAEWEKVSIVQNFENYPYTTWDCDKSIWRYNTPDNSVEYNKDIVHDGEKSIQLMSSGGGVASLLLNFRQTLTAGQQYKISFWITKQGNDNQPQIALAHKVYPDYLAADKLIEPITSKLETNGNWIRYEYTFKALTPWIALKVLDGDGVSFDNIVVDLVGEFVRRAETSADVLEGEFYGSTFEEALILDGAETIGEFAFAYNKFMTDIYISDSVTQIDEYAFWDCEGLTDVWYAGSHEDFLNMNIEDKNYALKDAVWHFDSCTLGQLHIYDDEIDSDCNICGVSRPNTKTGDVNSDGKINGRDYALLLQYLNDWDVTIDLYAADVNKDNNINGRDYALLLQYLNDWDVEF